MAFRQKASEQGWFYHAPKTQQAQPKVEAPPASQIPGLSDLAEMPQEYPPQRGMIKDTDSKYIIMAKQGGRRDLLSMRDPLPKQEAKGYPKVDWFYLEDNRIEDEAAKTGTDRKYQSMMPEYMVHDVYTPSWQDEQDSNDSAGKSKKAPFAFDSTTVFQREGDHCTDKTQKLPEEKRIGYGVRAEKMKNKTIQHTTPKPDRAKPPSSQMEQKKYNAMPAPKDDEKTDMSKVLSFGYGQEWYDAHDKWEEEHHHKISGKAKDIPVTEYQQSIAGNTPGKPGSRHHRTTSKNSSDQMKLVLTRENGHGDFIK